MLLKSLRLSGFKSFPNRTDFNFTDGLTCFVGPNGCGKTNIVEAIRWVLGEQNPQRLRCEKMEDIIFNGSASRPPTGMAEVTLIISNDDGNLPIDYTDVAITRRLYRSGESEYFINRNPVRLKDITELFLNTGVGARTYSLFEQSMIDKILSKDPHQRRYFFEEASKTAKYRERKKETLRKLEATEQDLLSVREVALEIRRHTRSLKRQASSARRHLRLKEELKKVETSFFKKRYEEINSEIENLNDKKKKIVSARDELLNSLSNNKTKIQTLKNESSNIVNEVVKVERMIVKIDAEIKENEKEAVSYKERLKALAENKKSLKEDVKLSMKKNKEITIRIRDNEAKLKKIEHSLSKIRDKLKNCEAEKIEIEGRIVKTKEEYNRTKDKYMSLFTSEKEKKSELLHLRTKEDGEEYQNRNLKIELSNLNKDVCSTGEEIKLRTEAIGNLKKDEAILKTELETLKEKKENFANSLAEMNSEIENLSRKIEKEREELKSLLKDKSCLFTGDVLSEIVDITPGYESAIETALGDRVSAVVVKSEAEAVEHIKYLKEHDLPRTSFVVSQEGEQKELPDDKDIIGRATDFVSSKSKQILGRLLGNFAVVKDLRTGINLSKKYKEINFCTLTGEVVRTDGIIAGGKFVDKIIGRKERIDELQRQIEIHTKSLVLAEKNRNTLNSELSKIERTILKKESSIRDITLKRAGLDIEKSQLELKKSDLQRRVYQISTSLKSTKEKIEKLENKIKTAEAQYQSIKSNKDTHELALEEVEKTRSRTENLNRKILKKLDELKLNSFHLETEYNNIRNRIESSRNTLNEIKENRIKSEERLDLIATKSKQLEEGYKRCTHLIKEKIEKRNLALERTDELSHKKGELAEELSNAEAESNTLQKEIEGCREEIHQTEMDILELVAQRKNLSQKVLDEYGVKLGEFESEIEEVTEEKIAEIREKLNRLGLVNPLALEEYEQEKERLEFLNAQIGDLTGAKESLIETISHLDKSAREQFCRVFEDIEKKFKEIFGKLFEEGEADLILEKGKDPLDASIDIIACPAGKKFRSIELLSGGERSLVAIALLFAIYLTSPSPFCILDEIDAPLDDSNIVRFAYLLKDLSKYAQFAIISHNKKTMEVATSLYGITMPEPGVSEVISVDFR